MKIAIIIMVFLSVHLFSLADDQLKACEEKQLNREQAWLNSFSTDEKIWWKIFYKHYQDASNCYSKSKKGQSVLVNKLLELLVHDWNAINDVAHTLRSDVALKEIIQKQAKSGKNNRYYQREINTLAMNSCPEGYDEECKMFIGLNNINIINPRGSNITDGPIYPK